MRVREEIDFLRYAADTLREIAAAELAISEPLHTMADQAEAQADKLDMEYGEFTAEH